MCDDSPIEECFKSLTEKEIANIEEKSTNDQSIAVIFPALAAKLRFLLHGILHNHPALQTVSVGKEPNRHPIVFRSRHPNKTIIDVPEGKFFKSQLAEFVFRTGCPDTFSLCKPVNDFNIFVTNVDKLDDDFSNMYSYVAVSKGIKYIEIRKTLRTFYRQGLVNCYEVSRLANKPDHIIITNSNDTLVELTKSFKDDLCLVDVQNVTGSIANVLNIMAKCGRLLPATPRTLIDRSAAANIMSRHLCINKNSKAKPCNPVMF